MDGQRGVPRKNPGAPFTEEELLQYGFPDVTDGELEDMILDNL